LNRKLKAYSLPEMSISFYIFVIVSFLMLSASLMIGKVYRYYRSNKIEEWINGVNLLETDIAREENVHLFKTYGANYEIYVTRKDEKPEMYRYRVTENFEFVRGDINGKGYQPVFRDVFDVYVYPKNEKSFEIEVLFFNGDKRKATIFANVVSVG